VENPYHRKRVPNAVLYISIVWRRRGEVHEDDRDVKVNALQLASGKQEIRLNHAT